MHPKLRDSSKKKPEPYPLGQFSKEHVHEISKRIVYLYAFGKADINGDEWANTFAKGVGGGHLPKPLGLADVVKEGFAWSTKSVKASKPHASKIVRAISGRNSLHFSYGTVDPHKNPQKAGEEILGIWNERRSIALSEYDDLRIAIFIRNINLMEFTLFEVEAEKYNPKSYEWKINNRNNIEGYEIVTGKHKFTLQSHGSQFTIKYDVPDDALKFNIKRPPVLEYEKTMQNLGFDDSWVTIRSNA